MSPAAAPRPRRLVQLLSGISFRLLAFNVLLIFLPAAGVLYLDVFEQQRLEAQESSMVQQGRILAAALASRGDELAAGAQPVLDELDRRVTARLRVVDGDGVVVADSSLPGAPDTDPTAAEPPEARRSWLYRLGLVLFRAYDRLLGRPTPEVAPGEPGVRGEPLDIAPVAAALDGRYGASTRISPGQRSVTLYSAIPVRRGGEVVGAVVVSQSTIRLLGDLYQVRLAIFRVFLASVVVAVVLTLLVSTTIVRPLRRLRRQARAPLVRHARLQDRFSGTGKADEIGDLARALQDLTRRLEQHLDFIGSFAADVSHEFKNPLASIRSAAEMAVEVDDAGDRDRFLGVVLAEVARMEKLLAEVRDITEIDARLEAEGRSRVEVGTLLDNLLASRRLHRQRGPEVVLERRDEVTVEAAPGRLQQVFDNILDNAESFTPQGAEVRVTVAVEGEEGVVRVEDQGPGIPEEHRERVFDRFFSYRDGGHDEGHSGLGLAIVKAIVERYGGRVAVGEGAAGGAAVEIRLPRF